LEFKGVGKVEVPQVIREGRQFIQEVRENLRDQEFLVNGKLKESFETVTQKYPTIFVKRK
jgi:hypothetical protein